MWLLPNIFGKNDRYVGILPLSFWAYYSWLTNSFFSILLLIIGIFPLICQVYRDEIDQRIKEKRLKTTKDFSMFILKTPLLAISAVIGLFYLLFTILYPAFIEKDQIIYFLWVCNIIGFVYLVLMLSLRKDYRKKFKEIVFFAKKSKVKS